MKRVLLTVHKFFPQHRAGTEVLTLKVAQELKNRGYETLVVTADPPDLDARHSSGDDTENFTHDGIDVHVIREPLRLRNYTFRHEFDHPEIAEHFGQIIERFKPDLVHVFHAQNLSGRIVHEAKSKNIPIVASLTDFWFVCPVVQLKRPDGALCRGPKNLASNCLTCYTPALFPPQSQIEEALEKKIPVARQLLRALPGPAKQLFLTTASCAFKAGKLPSAISATVSRPQYLRSAANIFDAIMVPTELMRAIFQENGIQANLIHKVPFGLDTAPLLRFQQKTQSESVRIGFVGTIFEHKGLDLLIAAFQQLPPSTKAVLKIYGDPAQFPEYGERMLQMARYGPNRDKIEFLGTFPNSDLGDVLQNLDVLVVPSRWYENTPLVIQSAFATKTPVMATDLGGMSELVKHDVNGLLFEVNNVDALKTQLVRITKNKHLLHSLRHNIKDERTVSQMVDDIESIYRMVLNRPGAKSADPARDTHESMVS